MPPATKKPLLADRLLQLQACADARKWAKGFKTASAAWLKCTNPEWMLWALQQTDHMDDRKARKFACWCVRNTPLADGRVVWDLLTDERSWKAVEVAERFADGEATQEELAAAWDAARAAALDAAWDAALDAALDAARAVAWAAARAVARAAAWDTSRDAQAKAIRKFFGNPFKGE